MGHWKRKATLGSLTWTFFSVLRNLGVVGINCVVGGGEEGTGRVNYQAPAMPAALTFPEDLQHK